MPVIRARPALDLEWPDAPVPSRPQGRAPSTPPRRTPRRASSTPPSSSSWSTASRRRACAASRPRPRVNLAAVNYHFGSKEELFQAVLTRRLDPMNQERIDLLDAARARGGRASPSACEKILFAMLIPALRLARDEKRGGKNFLRLLGRAYADPAPFIRHFLSRAVRRDDRPLQGSVPQGAAAPVAPGAHVAAAFRDGRAFVHARRHRRAQALRAGDRRATRTTTSCCCSGWPRSWWPGSRRPRSATPASSSWSRD